MSNFNKKLIFKKFLIDNTYFFLLTALSLSLIVWVIQAVNFLDFVSEDGHGLKVYFIYTLLNFPKIFAKLMPIMFFISLYYTINKYDEKNELKIILDLYAKMVSEGSWKDYGLNISSKQVSFSVFKNSAENALYKICKNFKPNNKNLKY